MVERTTLDAVRARVGPLVTATGLAMLAIAYLGYSSDGHPQAAAPPRPSVTVTQTVGPTKPASPGGASSTPRSRPRQTSDGGRVAAVAAPETSTGGGASRQRPGNATPSGPAPHPPAASQPPASTPCDVGLSLLALNACLKLGGSR